MEMIGVVENQPSKIWYRCTRCRHASLIDVEALRLAQENAKKKLERSDCAEYSPEKTYNVGESIFHSELGDIGKIISKERTSGGARAIVVSFEKLGERRLLESVPGSLGERADQWFEQLPTIARRWVYVVGIVVSENEPIDRAIKRFKKKYERSGVLKEFKKRAYFTKPSVKKRMKKVKAIRRAQRAMAEQSWPLYPEEPKPIPS
jgi:small subunit ribosomal protein S21